MESPCELEGKLLGKRERVREKEGGAYVTYVHALVLFCEYGG